MLTRITYWHFIKTKVSKRLNYQFLSHITGVIYNSYNYLIMCTFVNF